MKLRTIFSFILLLFLFLINDSFYYVVNSAWDLLAGIESKAERKIEDREAIVVFENTEVDENITDISNQYFIKSAKILKGDELISLLSEQYRLQDSETLLGELVLPQVLEIKFQGELFREIESDLFIKILKDHSNLKRVLYNEDNYKELWEVLKITGNIRDILKRYQHYAYYGLGLFTLIILIYLRIVQEEKKKHFWKIYMKAGGSKTVMNLRKSLNAVFIVLLPAVIAWCGEYFLGMREIISETPDLFFHVLRLIFVLLISIIITNLIKGNNYD